MNKRSTRRARLAFVCLCVLLPVGEAAGDARGTDTLIRQVETHYNRAQTLRLRFSEHFEWRGRERPVESGVLALAKKGKMRWEYQQPPGKLFLLDGKTIYLYTAGDNRVERTPMKESDDLRAPLGFLLGNLDLKREFRDFRVKTGEGGDEWLAARAKSERTPYEDIEMLVSQSGAVQQLRIVGRDGSHLQFEFTGEEVNPRLDAALFRFVPPPGAEVVDAMEGR